MRRFGICILAAGVFGAGAAFAQSSQSTLSASPGFYTRFDSGPSFSTGAGGNIGTDLGTAGIGGVGVGYRFTPMFRTDFTLGYRGGYQFGGSNGPGVSIRDTDVSALTGMFNGYIDLGQYGRFTPYIGAGIGFSRNEIDDIRGTVGGAAFRLPGDDRVSFAWQTGVGTAVAINDKMSLDLGYRYEDLGLVRSQSIATLGGAPINTDAADGHIRAHEIQIGLRVKY